MNNEIKKVLNDVDTAFEVVRVSWDNPTPQAVSAMNEAWVKVRELLKAPTTPAPDAQKVLQKIVEAFPQMATDEPINGSDAVDAICGLWPEITGAVAVFPGNAKLRGTNDTVTLTKERRDDMLVGALEGGSNYWYFFAEEAIQMIESTSQSTEFYSSLWKAMEAGLEIPVHDIESNEQVGFLSLARMDEGEKLMQEKAPEHFAAILSEDDDAITADVWFQYVVLKDLIYG